MVLGSTQDISLQSALVLLHNISMPNMGLIHADGQLLGGQTQEDIFHKLFLIMNGKVERVKLE